MEESCCLGKVVGQSASEQMVDLGRDQGGREPSGRTWGGFVPRQQELKGCSGLPGISGEGGSRPREGDNGRE